MTALAILILVWFANDAAYDFIKAYEARTEVLKTKQ